MVVECHVFTQLGHYAAQFPKGQLRCLHSYSEGLNFSLVIKESWTNAAGVFECLLLQCLPQGSLILFLYFFKWSQSLQMEMCV